MVYFISDGLFTKIGSSKNVYKRLIELQIGNVRELSILMAIEGGIDIERFAQNYFEKYLSRGEWYEIPESKIVSFVNDFKQNESYLLQSNLLSKIKLSEFGLIDYRIWEYLVGLKKAYVVFDYDSVSNMCSRRAYFESKKKLIRLKFILKTNNKNMYNLNTKYIKNRI